MFLNHLRNVTDTHTQPFYSPFSGSTRVSRYQKKHSSTHTPPAYQPSSSASSIYHDPRIIASSCSIHIPGNLSAQLLTMSSSAYLWVWSPLLHTPYTSPNHCHPFATQVHTIITCFVVVATLCPLFLVSLSTPYLKLYLST